MTDLVVCAEAPITPGCCRIATRDIISIGVFDLDGCRPQCEGEFDADEEVVIYPVFVRDGQIDTDKSSVTV